MGVWRIGNGRRVRVLWDQWILGLETPLIPPKNLPAELLNEKVHSLINPLSSTWNLQAINSLFSPLVAETIRKIPLNLTPQEDRWVWREKRNGRYSVRSAYRLIHKTSYLSNGESSNVQELHGLCKKL